MVQTRETLSGAVLDHLVRQVETTPVFEEPYSHFYLDRVFPDDVYEQILRNMPPPPCYGGDNPRIHTRGDGMITRNIVSLSEPGVQQLPENIRHFWAEISAALCSSRLKKAVFGRLSRDLRRRFRRNPDQLESVEAYPKPALVKDLGGYEIRPHTDTSSKIVTMQFYLPEDALKSDLGTAVYRLRLTRLLSAGNRFQKVKQFAFLPNSGYAFAVGRRSWHGRETVPMASGERNSLMLIYYAQPGKGW